MSVVSYGNKYLSFHTFLVGNVIFVIEEVASNFSLVHKLEDSYSSKAEVFFTNSELREMNMGQTWLRFVLKML